MIPPPAGGPPQGGPEHLTTKSHDELRVQYSNPPNGGFPQVVG